jgi:hypothetical protein
MPMWELPLFTRLAASRRVLLAGAGGGFDVYAGLPLAHLAEVRATTTGEDNYFPERTLARCLHAQGLPDTVYAFEKVGVRPLRRSYEALVASLSPGAIVLVDGGTDLLMRGDEAGLGTPEEDMTSLAAVAGLTGVPTR